MIWLSFKEIAFIADLSDQFLHVIWLLRISRNQRVERRFRAIYWILARPGWHGLTVRGRQKVDKSAHFSNRFHIVAKRPVGHTGSRGMGDGATEFLMADLFVGNSFYYVGTSDEHV